MRKPKSEANTFLTHLFGRGLADERYAVERYSHARRRHQARARSRGWEAQKKTRDGLAPGCQGDAARPG